MIQNVFPHEKHFLKTPDYDFLRVFGCICFPLIGPFNKHKLELKYAPCVFLGYCSNQHGYRCLLMYHVVFMYPDMLDFMKYCFILLSPMSCLCNQLLLRILLHLLICFIPFNSSLWTYFESLRSHLQTPFASTFPISTAEALCIVPTEASLPSNIADPNSCPP